MKHDYIKSAGIRVRSDRISEKYMSMKLDVAGINIYLLIAT